MSIAPPAPQSLSVRMAHIGRCVLSCKISSKAFLRKKPRANECPHTKAAVAPEPARGDPHDRDDLRAGPYQPRHLDPQSATAVGQVPARLGVRGHGALMLFSGALRHGLIVWLLLLCVGAFDEWHQISIPGRQASAYDLLADALGVALGIWVAGRVRRLIRVEA